MDKLFQIKLPNELNNNNVTLFSFRHGFGGLKIDDRYSKVSGFSFSGNEGIINYFNNVHGFFGQLAIENPNIIFNVKMKWKTGWIDHVFEAIENFTKINPKLILNLRFYGGETNALDLIKNLMLLLVLILPP